MKVSSQHFIWIELDNLVNELVESYEENNVDEIKMSIRTLIEDVVKVYKEEH